MRSDASRRLLKHEKTKKTKTSNKEKKRGTRYVQSTNKRTGRGGAMTMISYLGLVYAVPRRGGCPCLGGLGVAGGDKPRVIVLLE